MELFQYKLYMQVTQSTERFHAHGISVLLVVLASLMFLVYTLVNKKKEDFMKEDYLILLIFGSVMLIYLNLLLYYLSAIFSGLSCLASWYPWLFGWVVPIPYIGVIYYTLNDLPRFKKHAIIGCCFLYFAYVYLFYVYPENNFVINYDYSGFPDLAFKGVIQLIFFLFTMLVIYGIINLYSKSKDLPDIIKKTKSLLMVLGISILIIFAIFDTILSSEQLQILIFSRNGMIFGLTLLFLAANYSELISNLFQDETEKKQG